MTDTPPKRRKMALGRGLGALIPGFETADPVGEIDPKDYFFCALDQIQPNRHQPRIHFAEEELAELSSSIKEQGVLQPLLVRRVDQGYELVAGERRLRAARMAGLDKVPVVVREITDRELLVISIVENIQRENLNPMEEAEAYERLMSEFKLTQEQVALQVGKSRSAVANFLRLRQLPLQIKESLMEGSLSMGHARALLGAETSAQQLAAYRLVISRGLSVRETEELVKRLKTEKKAASPTSTDLYFANLSDELSRHLGTSVKIKHRGKQGKLEIVYYNSDDLDQLIARLKTV